MWSARMYDSAMDSPLPIARPWTPPETDAEASPRSDYFSDPFRPPSSYSDRENRWTSHPDELGKMNVRCDTPTEAQNLSRPKPTNRVTEPAPYTPVKSLNYGSANTNGALRYPYTPDSSRILRRNTDIPSSPMPWDQYSEHSVSPVQDALSACIAQFENLIHSQQPDEDQMEYVVAQFEAMTSYLSAPDSQTRTTDDHLFNEPEQSPTGLGISTDVNDRMVKVDDMSKEAHEAYVSEVGNYIDGVKRYIEDLKMRLDEVKTLNSIQLDVINDLRRQMRSVRQGMRSSLDMRDDMNLVEHELNKLADLDIESLEVTEAASTSEPHKEFGLDSWETLVPESSQHPDTQTLDKADDTPSKPRKQVQILEPPRYKVIHIVRTPERRSFWASFAEALDSFGAMLRDE